MGAETPRTGQQQPSRRLWYLNVLLVDDDLADTSLILSILRRHPSVSTATASDAPELVLRQLAEPKRVTPDLILLDIHMPKVNGFDFLEGLRQIPSMAQVPVAFLTTSSLVSDVARTRASSASLYLVKPDSYLELQSLLNKVLIAAASGRWNGQT